MITSHIDVSSSKGYLFFFNFLKNTKKFLYVDKYVFKTMLKSNVVTFEKNK